MKTTYTFPIAEIIARDIEVDILTVSSSDQLVKAPEDWFDGSNLID